MLHNRLMNKCKYKIELCLDGFDLQCGEGSDVGLVNSTPFTYFKENNRVAEKRRRQPVKSET